MTAGAHSCSLYSRSFQGPRRHSPMSFKGDYSCFFMFLELDAREEHWQDIFKRSKQQKFYWQTLENHGALEKFTTTFNQYKAFYKALP